MPAKVTRVTATSSSVAVVDVSRLDDRLLVQHVAMPVEVKLTNATFEWNREARHGVVGKLRQVRQAADVNQLIECVVENGIRLEKVR